MPATPSRLQDLGPRIARGDVDAFEQLFRRLHAPLCEVVDAYVHSQDIAEELVQDLFLALWVHRTRLGKTESLAGYIFAAARNRAVQWIRHRTVAERGARILSADVAESSMAPSADVTVDRRETAYALRRAIDSLPPRIRLAIVLRTYYEMPVAEIAAAMGISVKGAEKLLTAARQRLRTQLGERVNLDPSR